MAIIDDSKCLMPPKIMHRRTLLASLNCDGPLGLALLAALALPWLLLAGGPQWTAALRYERAALHGGEWWRLLSAHWVHLGAGHLALDSAGLVLLWTLYARALRPWEWLLVMIGATAMIDAGLWWAQPQVQWYVGLSGLLHGAWAAGALALAWRRGGWDWLMPAALVLKLLLEQRAGASLVAPDFPVVTVAHLYGALGGLGSYAALALARKPL
jgi:rhomboid family GlyGly-CTERM serine protease